MQNNQYGIEAMVTKAIINPFSGVEPEKFSTFIIQMTTALSAKEISSEAYNVIKPGSIIGNFEKMCWDIHDRYRGARLSVIIVQVERYVEIITSGMLTFVEPNNVTAECKRAFAEKLDLYNFTYDDNRRNAECVKVTLLWETLVDFVAFSKVSIEGSHIKDFIQRYVRENDSQPLSIDISSTKELLQLLQGKSEYSCSI